MCDMHKGRDADINWKTNSNILVVASGRRIRAWARSVRSFRTSGFNIMAAELGAPLHNAAGFVASK